MPECVLFTPSATECGYAFQIADDAGAVVDVVTTAGGTGVQGAFVDVAAFVADGDAHVHAEASRSLHTQLTACVRTAHTLPMNHSELKKQRVGCVRYARTRLLD